MKKFLLILFSIVLIIGLIVGGIFLYVYMSSDKFVCKSDEGSITLMYKDETLKGYTANGINYDMDVAKNSIKIVGMKEYLRQFKEWFESNTTGTCDNIE